MGSTGLSSGWLSVATNRTYLGTVTAFRTGKNIIKVARHSLAARKELYFFIFCFFKSDSSSKYDGLDGRKEACLRASNIQREQLDSEIRNFWSVQLAIIYTLSWPNAGGPAIRLLFITDVASSDQYNPYQATLDPSIRSGCLPYINVLDI